MLILQPSGAEMPTTILVVDDAAQIRDVVKRILGGCGYTVLEAKDGKTCMRVFQEHSGPIHLLLTDIFMTGMNGGRWPTTCLPHVRISKSSVCRVIQPRRC